jgi:hypothetical protein
VPRVVLSPLYFVSEYVLRKPLGAAVVAAEHADLPRKAYDFFAFGPDHKAGIVPVGFYDFDFYPSFGLFAFWNDAGFEGQDLHAHFEMWPTNWWAGSLTQKVRFDSTHELQLRVEGMTRPDRTFYGIGPSTLQSYQSRYTRDHAEAAGWYDWRYWRASHLRVSAGFRTDNLRGGNFGSDPSLEQQAATGAFAIPDGYGRADAVPYGRVVLSIDTRETDPEMKSRLPWGSGVRVELMGEPGGNLHPPTAAWVKYGGHVGGFVDLDGHQRVVSLVVGASFVDPLSSSDPIPFTELTWMGGDSPMRGYFSGRLIDRSGAAASLRYLWPIGPYLAGTIQGGLGNVFPGHLDGLRPNLLRYSGSVGISTPKFSDYPLEFIFGFGSETFEHGAQIDSLRVTVSLSHGF